LKYAFIAKHQSIYSVTRMCRVLRLHPSGYYAWKAQPQSQRAIDDQRLLDMRDMGEQCSRHCVARLLRCAGIKAQRGYGKRPYVRGGVPAVVAPNLLSQQFTVNAPNKVWVTDITYISTHEGWLYLATVIDLFSRQVIGWATGSRIDTQLPLDALHMAIWHRRPRETVIVHSDQGCQFTSHEWQRFLASHNLQPSMSRRGNCHDNAVAESFLLISIQK